MQIWPCLWYRVILPIPYTLPPASYTSQDRPWCVDIDHSGMDSLGHKIDGPVESFYGHVQPPD